MPVRVSCINGKCRVSTPNQVHAYATSRAKAERQAKLLRAIDHGWKPTKKAAKESVGVEAARLVNALLERDDIGKLDIPASGRAYARLRGGIPALQRKEQLYIRMGRDLANKGKSVRGFRDYDGSAYTGKHENFDSEKDADTDKAMERGHVEPTHFGGTWPKGISPKGKTAGKFKFPANFKVGHSIKS